jgi:hypothetical protein
MPQAFRATLRHRIATVAVAALLLLCNAAAGDQPRFEVVASPLTANGAGNNLSLTA